VTPFVPTAAREVQLFLLALFRVGGLLLVAPIFGSRQVPQPVKLALALVLAGGLTPALASRPFQPARDLPTLAAWIAAETAVGVLLGYAARLVFSAIGMAGEFMGLQMGFGVVSTIDPQFAGQASVMAQFLDLFTILVFLALDGHHLFVQAIWGSFAMIPLGGFAPGGRLFGALLTTFTATFVTAIKLAAPVTVAAFLVNVALAFVARVVPQMNVFVVAMPLTIGVGLLTLMAALAFLASAGGGVFRGIGTSMEGILRTVGHGVR
jgi:flagellar biosynthetic protein FliR